MFIAPVHRRFSGGKEEARVWKVRQSENAGNVARDQVGAAEEADEPAGEQAGRAEPLGVDAEEQRRRGPRDPDTAQMLQVERKLGRRGLSASHQTHDTCLNGRQASTPAREETHFLPADIGGETALPDIACHPARVFTSYSNIDIIL
jgi:hypothetical protein